ncbi:MAG: tRNA (N(6)-L-threonylcarbamoyladenosine(37)-C(2))-methylthiotransferase MtaB [Clostridia bacterium]|nr:tRNA (N(6)-L-threonylcarbamoyladenosine(37)-C(2))-methylthiotransferase MtaB [Clostridia bacterium]
MTHQNRTVGVATLGCKVNQYESRAIEEALESRGYQICPHEAVCDAYVVNTCTVTAESDRKCRQLIRRLISQNPAAFVVVTGCFAQADPEGAALEGVDAVIGNEQKMRVAEIVDELLRQGCKNENALIEVSEIKEARCFEPMHITSFDRTRTYVKIEDGCDSHCTYCAIRGARGPVRSKPLPEVLEQVRVLIDNGCAEIVLTGIETASWGKDLQEGDFGDLLCAVDALPGIGRVRLGSLDPAQIRPKFVEKIAALPSLAPHFHLSLQSGSSRVLAAMKRKYNREQAMDALSLLREHIPGVQFTTDVIVGFPGETEEDFEQTLDFIRKARFLQIHAFPYSGRKNTPAIRLPGQVPMQVRRERLHVLQKVQNEIRAQLLTEILESSPCKQVLFETDHDGYAIGHTPEFIEVKVSTDTPLCGTTRTVQLTQITQTGCEGILLP